MPTPRTTRTRMPASHTRADAPVAIVITADHVYLPIDEFGNVGAPWTASDVSTSRVSKRTRLTVPADLARFLSDRDQAEITAPAPLPAASSGDASAEALAKRKGV